MLTRRKGDLAEQAALEYLCLQGLRLITRNFNCKLGEIDLIMAHQSRLQSRILVFIEVRYRASTVYGGPAASITNTKRLRIIRTAKHFLQTHPKYKVWPSRFDVVAITNGLPALNIEWLVSAFES